MRLGFVFTLDALMGLVAIIIVVSTIMLMTVHVPDVYTKYVKARDYLEMKYYNQTYGVSIDEDELSKYANVCDDPNGLKVRLYYWDNDTNTVNHMEVTVC